MANEFYDPTRPVPRAAEVHPGYEIISENVARHYHKAGYMVIEQRFRNKLDRRDVMTIKTAVTPNGHYIGDPKFAHHLCVVRGITPELIDDKHGVCSVGKDKHGKWWGWSHRAIYGFKKGSKLRAGDVGEETLPRGFVAKDEADARAMAVAFASEVA